MTFERVTTLDELWSGEARATTLNGVKLVLLRFGESVYAYEDKCAHRAFPLSKGILKGKTLVCAAHEWEFDGETGCGINPESARLRAYPVQLRGRDIYIDIEEPTRAPPNP